MLHDTTGSASHPEHAAGWTKDRVERLKALWTDGKSASEIMAILGGGVTRSGVIGKVHRLKLPGRKTDVRPKPKADDSRPARRNGNAGQPKAAAIRHRIAVQMPVEPLPIEEGVDVTHLLGLQQLNDHVCRWPIGDPLLPDFGFCGDPTKAGSKYCPKHHRRAYI